MVAGNAISRRSKQRTCAEPIGRRPQRALEVATFPACVAVTPHALRLQTSVHGVSEPVHRVPANGWETLRCPRRATCGDLVGPVGLETAIEAAAQHSDGLADAVADSGPATWPAVRTWCGWIFASGSGPKTGSSSRRRIPR